MSSSKKPEADFATPEPAAADLPPAVSPAQETTSGVRGPSMLPQSTCLDQETLSAVREALNVIVARAEFIEEILAGVPTDTDGTDDAADAFESEDGELGDDAEVPDFALSGRGPGRPPQPHPTWASFYRATYH